MKIVFSPEETYVNQIRSWLHQELVNRKNQFYYNFINADFTGTNFICYVNEDDEAIGFMQYSLSEKVAHIDIAVVKFEHQRKGIGGMLLNALTAMFVNKGAVAISLMCEPKSSERRWKKLGFKSFKEVENHGFLSSRNFGHPWLYKIIIPYQKATRSLKLHSYIELWTQEEHVVQSRNIQPTYRWDANLTKNPIIYPTDHDWMIRYVKQGEVIYQGKVKRFNFGHSDHDNFLIVDRLLY